MATGIDQSLTCTISGLSQDTPVTWVDPDNNEISNTDTSNYAIDQGTFIFGSKASTLTVKQSKLENLPSSSIFTCKLKSALYPTYSPEVVKEMTLTLIGLSKFVLMLEFLLTIGCCHLKMCFCLHFLINYIAQVCNRLTRKSLLQLKQPFLVLFLVSPDNWTRSFGGKMVPTLHLCQEATMLYPSEPTVPTPKPQLSQ